MKKRKRFVIKCLKPRYFVYIFLVSIFVLSICISSQYKTEFVSIPRDKPIIVIDGGHGGVDGGAIGRFTGVLESELNLIYAKNLGTQLKEYGFDVVMTRKDKNGLYDPNASNLKKSDMKKRKEIIDSSRCDLVVSIHMNSYPLSSSRGAQVFYKKENAAGKALGVSVQSQLKNILQNTNKRVSVGDYYILNCTSKPAVLIECGFLSNKSEETLLQQKAYQDKFCYAVLCGIIDYFGVSF